MPEFQQPPVEMIRYEIELIAAKDSTPRPVPQHRAPAKSGRR
jgi:hypothetical protein